MVLPVDSICESVAVVVQKEGTGTETLAETGEVIYRVRKIEAPDVTVRVVQRDLLVYDGSAGFARDDLGGFGVWRDSWNGHSCPHAQYPKCD